MKPIKTRPFISITGQDWSYVLHHYTRDREKLLQWRGEGYPIYTYNINMHLLCDWSEFLPKNVHERTGSFIKSVWSKVQFKHTTLLPWSVCRV